MQPMVTRLVILVLILVCGVGLYLGVDTMQAAPLKQAQQVAQSRFGADLLKLCQGATQTRGGKLPADVKIGAINSIDNTVYDTYDAAMPASVKATDNTDVNVLLCLKEEINEFDTTYYGASHKYKCTQYERDLIASLVDVKTGKTLDSRKFDGQTPPDCPDKAGTNLTRTGGIPLASDITTWITRHAKSNL